MTAAETRHADVAILGGGLAGLCLALQIHRRRPGTRIVILERRPTPPPLAAFKVGESSVEMASHYFQSILGLDDLLDVELKKFGLRFFFSANGNREISERLECGPSRYFTVPSFQIDRGRFEAALAERLAQLGVPVLRGATVKNIDGLDEPGRKRVTAAGPNGVIELDARWVVDTAGRSELLKRRLDLRSESPHRINAAWFRVDADIDIDSWSRSRSWRERFAEPRRLSTNHLMGEGYWVWLIPLSGGQTSIGVVADDSLHPFDELRTFERTLSWLERHEPQLHGELLPTLESRLDFITYKHFARASKRMYSGNGWCLSGDAGTFNDPLYSPGSDLIGMSNGFITDLVCRQLNGENVEARARRYEKRYINIFRMWMTIYVNQYPIMGSPRVMSMKILWDFAMYWGGIALLFMHDKLADDAFMERAQPVLLSFAQQGLVMQRMFRRWSTLDREPVANAFLDYSGLPVLEELNRLLVEPMDDEALFHQLSRNLATVQAVAAEIRDVAERCDASLVGSMSSAPATSTHLESAIATLVPEAAPARATSASNR